MLNLFLKYFGYDKVHSIMAAMKTVNISNVVNFKEGNLHSIHQDVIRLFKEFGDPISSLQQEDILEYINTIDRKNKTPSEIKKSWRNIALFLLFLRYQPEYKKIDDIKPWELSFFISDFLSDEFIRGPEDRFALAREIFNTLEGFLFFLKETGKVKSLKNLHLAKKGILKNGKICKLRRPTPSWNEVVITAENPTNGNRYNFTLGDYWLILVREIDFNGDWIKMIEFLKRNRVPSREQKIKLVQRLMDISQEANFDTYELVFREPSSRDISKAEKHFFEDFL